MLSVVTVDPSPIFHVIPTVARTVTKLSSSIYFFVSLMTERQTCGLRVCLVGLVRCTAVQALFQIPTCMTEILRASLPRDENKHCRRSEFTLPTILALLYPQYIHFSCSDVYDCCCQPLCDQLASPGTVGFRLTHHYTGGVPHTGGTFESTSAL